VEGLEPGTYHLIARGEKGGVALLRNVLLRAGVEPDELTVTLSTGARLRIRNEAKEGSMFYSVRQEGVRLAGSVLRPGHSEETEVTPGHVLIEISWPPSASEVRELDLGAGEEKEVGFGGH
jgi:hypothetical protein